MKTAKEILKEYEDENEFHFHQFDKNNIIVPAMEEYANQTSRPAQGNISEGEDFKAKYEKCIQVIKRFDAGIIGMYDL